MARLPIVNGDDGTWGDILNDYLSQTLKADGTIKDNAVTSSALAPNSVTNAAIATGAVNTTSIADGAVTEAKLDSAAQTKLNAPGDWNTLSNKPAVVAAGADQAAARTAIGAGTASTKADVGLGNVDNTSDASKPISTAAQSALNNKVAKGELVINAADYGVVADSATDDSAALQSAIDAAATAGGGTVFLPKGTIKVSSEITVPEHIWITAEAPGGWENYGVVNAGTTIRLADSSGLTASQGVVRFRYAGTQTTERRHQGGMVGITIDGNRSTNTANSGVVMAGVRFIHLERVHAIRCGLHGFSSVTDGTATSEMSFLDTFAGFNGDSGYRLFGGDSTIVGAMAGVNDGDGFYLGLGATVCTGLSSWNNKRDGLIIASTAATEFLSIVGGQFYDNDRAGITVESPGANAMLGNSIVGASCHGNGRQDFNSYPSATDRVGIRVLGAHTPIMLAIHSVSAGNRSYTLPDEFQQYGVALQTAACNPTVSGVSGDNAVSLWYLVDTTAIPENQAGRLIPLKDNTFALGRVSNRWSNLIGLRHEVYDSTGSAQPRVRVGSTLGGPELHFGPGGASSTDWMMSRTANDVVTIAAGDSLAVDGTWNGGTFRLGTYRLWVDATGALRIKSGAPSSDTDGTVVGTQT